MFGAVSLPLERRGKGGGEKVSTKVMACYKEGGGVNGKRASFFLGDKWCKDKIPYMFFCFFLHLFLLTFWYYLLILSSGGVVPMVWSLL